MAKQFDVDSILQTYRDLHDQAFQANQTRYDDIIGQIGQTSDQVGGSYDQAFNLTQTIGDAERERIGMGETRALASSEQDLISRGLGQTTIRESARRGVRDDASRARNELQESIARTQAGVVQNRAGSEERLGGMLASFMEKRTDAYPDLGMMAQLLEQYGQGVGAGGEGPQNLFTGLSANARAGRDAFGNPIGGQTSFVSGAAAAPTFGQRGAGGGGGGTGATTVYGAGGGAGGGARGGAGGGNAQPIQAATEQSAARLVQGGQPDPAGAGVGGSAFDQMFVGQPVWGDASGGQANLGTYAGGGELSSVNLLDQMGNVDMDRVEMLEGGGATGAGAQGASGADGQSGGAGVDPARRRQLESQLQTLNQMDAVRSGGMTAFERQQYDDIMKEFGG